MRPDRRTRRDEAVARLERAAAPGFEPFAHDGPAVVVRTGRAGPVARALGAVVALVMLGFAGFSLLRLVAALAGVVPLAAPLTTGTLLMGLAMIAIAAAVGVVAALTALQPERELRLDPVAAEAVLTSRTPLRTRVDRYPLASLPAPTLRVQRGGGEDSPAVYLVVEMPDGRKLETSNPLFSAEVQRQQAELWQARIAAMVAAAAAAT